MTEYDLTSHQCDRQYAFCIARHIINVVFSEENRKDDIFLLPSFRPFLLHDNDKSDNSTIQSTFIDAEKASFQPSMPHDKDNSDGCAPHHPTLDVRKPLFTLTVNDGQDADGGTEDCVYADGSDRTADMPDGSYDIEHGKVYVYVTPLHINIRIADTQGHVICRLRSTRDFTRSACLLYGNDYNTRSLGLNDAVMMMMTFRGSYYDTAIIHAAAVKKGNAAYAFIGRSGIGKSTHARMWTEHIDGAHLLNDDSPIVRIIDGKAIVYGSPWSGKTPCYRNESAQLHAMAEIVRDSDNHITRLPPSVSFARLVSACSTLPCVASVHRNTTSIIMKLVTTLGGIYAMHCLPDAEAATVAHSGMTQKG